MKLLNKHFFINLIFLGIGVFSFWRMAQHIDIKSTLATLTSLKIEIVLLVLVATICAHLFRVMRWMLLLNSHKKQINFVSTWGALLYGYFINLGIPRLGEFTRAGAIKKQSKIAFPFVLGTIIVERVIDILTLLFLLVGYFLFYNKLLIQFYDEKVANNLIDLPELPIWLLIVLFVGCGIGGYFIFKKLPSILKTQLRTLLSGIRSLLIMPHKLQFFTLTIGIWISYFFTSYLCFFTFDHSYNLTVTTGISVLVLGSIARSIPIQGGAMGVYHLAVVAVLTLSAFGVDQQTAFTIAVIIHAIQTLFQLFVGGLMGLYVSFK